MSSATFQDLTTVLTGRLAHISLFDVAHFALSKRLSGVLHVKSGSVEGKLQFNQGHLLTVEDKQGGTDLDAALRLFQLVEGMFHFKREPVDPTGRIELSTENYLLEVARLIDEGHRGDVESADGTTPDVESLLTKKPGAEFLKLLALLDAARKEQLSKPRNDFEAFLHTAVGARGETVWLRVGSIPRTWRGRKPLALSKELLDPARFESLVRCAFGDAAPADGAHAMTYDAGALGLFHVELWPGYPGPTMLAHGLSSAVPSFDQLGLPAAELAGLCAHTAGLVVITGVHGAGKSSAAAAMIDSINATSPRAICVLEATTRHLHRDRMGTVLQQLLPTMQAADALEVVLKRRPDVLVIDPVEAAETARRLVVEAETGVLSIGVVCAPSAEAALLRLAGDASSRPERIERVLHAVVMLTPADGDGPPSCRIIGPGDINWPELRTAAPPSD